MRYRAAEIRGEASVEVQRRLRAAVVVRGRGAAAEEPRADERDEDGGHAEAERGAEEIQLRPEHPPQSPPPLAAAPRAGAPTRLPPAPTKASGNPTAQTGARRCGESREL